MLIVLPCGRGCSGSVNNLVSSVVVGSFSGYFGLMSELLSWFWLVVFVVVAAELKHLVAGLR